MEEVEGGDEGRAHDSAGWREDSLARGADAVAQYRKTEENAAADGADVNVVVCPGVAAGLPSAGILQSSLSGEVAAFGCNVSAWAPALQMRELDRRISMACALSMVPCLTSLHIRAKVAHDAGSGGPRCLILTIRLARDIFFDSCTDLE